MMRRLALWMLVVAPGVAAILVCGFYLFSDWAALNVAFARFERVASEGGDLRALFLAQSLDQVYRINCFADGVGVMLGAVLTAIGVHGLCVIPADQSGDKKSNGREVLAGAAGVGAALLLCVYLIGGVGSTNALRQAIVHGDADAVRAQVRGGSNVNDAFWWGARPLKLARGAAGGPERAQVIRALKDAGARE
ncbi:MAG: hypothetical protein ACO1SX_15465 [Actinomycetota bacterium]